MESNVFPTSKELLTPNNCEPFSNIIKGEYPDVDAYLDIHYTLLREDFIRPIREGIALLKNTSRSSTNVGTLRRFHGVRFHNINKVSHELGIDVRFSTEECADEDWENSKRFMRGSLLIFSKDNFETVIMGTVLNYNPEKLRNGLVTVQLNKICHSALERCADHYVMAEPDTYYLPYSQVMKVLLTLDERNFPFRNEIVYAYNGSFELEYIDESTCYQLPQGGSIPLLEMRQHLKPQDIQLDESQFSALIMALTQRLTVIQGPPGTGKTHLGTTIAEFLLINSSVWNVTRNTPMLVVCATNHALDQFLERLLRVTDKIVRVGDQSKNQNLNNYSLQYLLQMSEDERETQSLAMRTSYKQMMQSWNEVEIGFKDKGGIGASLVEKYEWEKRMTMLEMEYHKKVKAFKEVQQDKGLQKMCEALVIGMTTTCAAQMNNTLRKLRPPIVIVEEAAEIFETHIVAALTQHCKHLILIGDHKQLRPTTSHPHLSEKYHLDVSLFERLINNGIPHNILQKQYRMQPEIAKLLCPVFYTNLNNDTSLLHRPAIRGMKKKLFFMTHTFSEKQHRATHGYSNIFEATILIALCHHLLNHGCKVEDIVILSMYTQQVKLLKQLQHNERTLSGLNITSVDNFQGEESRIVLLSLVRNNTESIGFLGTPSRICVALSRAQDGLYILGNMDLLASKSPVWRRLREVFAQQEALGHGLPINCTRHLISTAAGVRQVEANLKCSSC